MTEWKRHGVIFEGVNGRAQCPVVDTNNEDFWRIYFSHRDFNGHSHTSYIDVEKGNPENILYKSNHPVLSPGKLGSVDYTGTMATSIITLNGTLKYMFYIGWTQRVDVPYFNTTCLAISANGNEWNKVGPILSPSIIDPGYSGTFYPILNHSKTQYTALYLSCFEWEESQIKDGLGTSRSVDPRYNFRTAISRDGVTWQQGEIAIDLEEHEGGVSQATIWYNPMRGVYQAWYSVRDRYDFRDNPKKSYRIVYADSYDLVTWNKSKENSLYPTGNPNDWDGIMCCYPCIVEYEGTLFMFYNGNGFGQTGIGYATWKF